MIETLFNSIKKEQLIEPGDKIIVGLSGGPDSVFLLHLLHIYSQKNQIDLIGAHFNHQWRSNAVNDEEFCKNLCEYYKIPFFVGLAQDYSASIKYNGSKEELGRKMRHLFFNELKNNVKATKIALAHHANDQEETFFIRLIRGTGITGLSCMKNKDRSLIRPLLSIYKEEIVNYLKNNKIGYCIDETNNSSEFLRNRIRKTVIPSLTTVDKRFHQTFMKTIKQIQETESFLADATKQNIEIVLKNNVLDINSFNKLHPYLQKRILLEWLIKNNVLFTPSTNLLEEIKRFLYNKKSHQHKLTELYSIKKKSFSAYIEKN